MAEVAIAIVENDDALREALNDLLRSYDYAPFMFSSAEEFLSCSSSSTIDCVILDQDLPGISGTNLQEVLTEKGLTPAIVFVTACDDLAVRQKALQNGARSFLSKSADADDIIKSILSAVPA